MDRVVAHQNTESGSCPLAAYRIVTSPRRTWYVRATYEDVIAQFNQTMATALPPAQLRTTWSLIRSQTGDFRAILDERGQRLTEDPFCDPARRPLLPPTQTQKGCLAMAGILMLSEPHRLHPTCTRFLSFDSASNACVLSASCRLKVFPDLTPHEKSRIVR